MPCYRCGTRQVDPVRGHSPWKRGVRADEQVLICPACQAEHDWMSDLDRCSGCGSVHLVRRLGEVECRDCGAVTAPAPGVVGVAGASPASLSGVGRDTGGAGPAAVGAGPAAPGPSEEVTVGAPGLSEEVASALDRVLGRVRGPVPARSGSG
jgi:hypothetical protein